MAMETWIPEDLRPRLSTLRKWKADADAQATASPLMKFLIEEEIAHIERIAGLEAWRAEQLLVESTWDVQAVGKALGIKLGEPIRPGILAGIEALKARLAKDGQ